MRIDIPRVFSFHSYKGGFEFTIGIIPIYAAMALALYFFLF